MYYKTALKRDHCIRGKKMIYSYLNENKLPFSQCGKLVVASNKEQVFYFYILFYIFFIFYFIFYFLFFIFYFLFFIFILLFLFLLYFILEREFLYFFIFCRISFIFDFLFLWSFLFFFVVESLLRLGSSFTYIGKTCN